MLHDVTNEHTTANCTPWDDWENYTATQKQNLMSFAMSNFDALGVSRRSLLLFRCFSNDGWLGLFLLDVENWSQ